MARAADRAGQMIARLFRTAPLTCAFLIVFWTVGALTGAITGAGDDLLARTGIGTESPVWTVFTSALWSMDLLGYVGTTVLLLVAGTFAEHSFGQLRTAAVFLSSHVAGSSLGLALVLIGRDVDWDWLESLVGEVAAGPSIGGVGLALALTFRMPPLWRRRIRLLMILSVLVLTLYSGWLEDLLRLSGGVAGLLIGALLWRTGPEHRARSLQETRVLVALLLAASALGPVVSMMSPYPNGPLWWLADVVAVAQPSQQDVDALCASDAAEFCRTMVVQLSYGRFPALVMSLLPALLLLVLAEGLRRGRRFAWRSALVFNLAFAAFIGSYVVYVAQFPDAGVLELAVVVRRPDAGAARDHRRAAGDPQALRRAAASACRQEVLAVHGGQRRIAVGAVRLRRVPGPRPVHAGAGVHRAARGPADAVPAAGIPRPGAVAVLRRGVRRRAAVRVHGRGLLADRAGRSADGVVAHVAVVVREGGGARA
ncbi:rhomboid family intramembrane serine protease [Lentzea sp. E54]|uniref:rhomboid family intramembrane serine protease n=1 Tax=Lentzea xerophila TaxID=3435883 RepID=UPI003DA3C85B